MARVTVVNDDAEFLDLVHDILEGDRYDTTLVDGDRPDALDLIRSSRPDLLMIDVRLGVEGDHGWEIAQPLRSEPQFGALPVLLCSADVFALQAPEVKPGSDSASRHTLQALHDRRPGRGDRNVLADPGLH